MLQFLPILGSVIDKIFPDATAAAEAKIKMIELEQAGEFKQIESDLKRDLAQMEINKVEAQSPSLFKSGWRPAVGWTCVAGLIYSTLVYPLLTWVAVVWNVLPPPNIDTGVLVTLLGGLLGIGTLRTYEKKMGLTK